MYTKTPQGLEPIVCQQDIKCTSINTLLYTLFNIWCQVYCIKLILHLGVFAIQLMLWSIYFYIEHYQVKCIWPRGNCYCYEIRFALNDHSCFIVSNNNQRYNCLPGQFSFIIRKVLVNGYSALK